MAISHASFLPVPSGVNLQYKKLLLIIDIPLFLVVFIGWFFVSGPLLSWISKLSYSIIFYPLLPLTFPCVGDLFAAFGSIAVLHAILIVINPKFRDMPFVFRDGALGLTIKAGAGLEFIFTDPGYATEFVRMNENSKIVT